MAVSSKAIAARDAILAQKDQVTRITGEIEPEDVDNLEEEIGGIATTVKSNHYTGGRINGHLAAIIRESDYRVVLSNNAWVYAPPVEQGAYDPVAAGNVNQAQRAQQEAIWTRAEGDLETDTGVKTAAKELIVYAVGDDALSGLKKRFVGYGAETPHSMIQYLRTKTCIKMTTLEKDNFKREGYSRQWDVTKSITHFFKSLDNLTIRLESRNIATSAEEKVSAAVARMWESSFFTEEKLIEWEQKAEVDKTWPNVQTYFGKLYHDHKQYSKATAKKARFTDGMNHVKSEPMPPGPTAEKEDAAMMFAMMQEQHSEQMNQMREQNKATLDMAQQGMREMAAMMKTMANNNHGGKL